MALSQKQEMFCMEYLVDLNGTQAAIRAGYSARTANEQAARLLAQVSIRARVDELMAARSMKTCVTAEMVVRELSRLAFVDPADAIDFQDGSVAGGISPDARAAIQSVKVKTIPTPDGPIVEREVRLHDKNKALELLGKHLGMYIERKEHSGPGGGPIQTTAIDLSNLSDEELTLLEKIVSRQS